jgi:hypothetical protein
MFARGTNACWLEAGERTGIQQPMLGPLSLPVHYLYRSIHSDAAATKDAYSQHMIGLHNQRMIQYGIAALTMWVVGIAFAYGMA